MNNMENKTILSIANIQFFNYLNTLSYIYIKYDIKKALFEAKQFVVDNTHSDNIEEVDAYLLSKIENELTSASKKVYLDWETYDEYVSELSQHILEGGYKSIYGIPRGGQLLALLISYKTNIPIYTSRPGEIIPSSTVIVDDILDSGETLKGYIEAGYDTFTIFRHIDCKYKPTTYLHDSNLWIVFPYETENDTLSEVNEDNIEDRRNNEKEKEK